MSRTYEPGRLLKVIPGIYDISLDYPDGDVRIGDVVAVQSHRDPEITALVFRTGKSVCLYKNEVSAIPKPRKKADVSDR